MFENSWECQQRLIPDARVILDVGADIGRTVSRYLGLFPRAVIYAFEPAPANIQRFKERLPKIEGRKRVQLFECAVLDCDGKAILHLYGHHHHHSILKNSTEFATREHNPDWVRKSIKVRTVTLDSFCAKKGLEQIDILKLDAEGAEPLILNGAHCLLSEKRVRLIFAEVMFFPFFEGQTYAWDLIPRFLEYGYKFHSLWSSGGRRICGANALFLREEWK